MLVKEVLLSLGIWKRYEMKTILLVVNITSDE